MKKRLHCATISPATCAERPRPLDQDGLLALFDSKETGGDVVLEPATDADMRGKYLQPAVSLEVIYDDA